MSNIAIIPARGGSKRIPGKNVKPFCGKPILVYSIEAAHNSGLFDEVMVSTDDDHIANIAAQAGARVPFFRSSKNSDDHSTLADVIDEVLSEYKWQYERGCCILPTAPLMQVKHLHTAYQLLLQGIFDSVRPVVKYSYPIQRSLKLGRDLRVDWVYPEYAAVRSQDLSETYHDAGQFYWFNTKSGMRSGNKGAIVIKEFESQDIDTEDDWKLAEIKYQYLKSVNR